MFWRWYIKIIRTILCILNLWESHLLPPGSCPPLAVFHPRLQLHLLLFWTHICHCHLQHNAGPHLQLYWIPSLKKRNRKPKKNHKQIELFEWNSIGPNLIVCQGRGCKPKHNIYLNGPKCKRNHSSLLLLRDVFRETQDQTKWHNKYQEETLFPHETKWSVWLHSAIDFNGETDSVWQAKNVTFKDFNTAFKCTSHYF